MSKTELKRLSIDGFQNQLSGRSSRTSTPDSSVGSTNLKSESSFKEKANLVNVKVQENFNEINKKLEDSTKSEKKPEPCGVEVIGLWGEHFFWWKQGRRKKKDLIPKRWKNKTLTSIIDKLKEPKLKLKDKKSVESIVERLKLSKSKGVEKSVGCVKTSSKAVKVCETNHSELQIIDKNLNENISQVKETAIIKENSSGSSVEVDITKKPGIDKLSEHIETLDKDKLNQNCDDEIHNRNERLDENKSSQPIEKEMSIQQNEIAEHKKTDKLCDNESNESSQPIEKEVITTINTDNVILNKNESNNFGKSSTVSELSIQQNKIVECKKTDKVCENESNKSSEPIEKEVSSVSENDKTCEDIKETSEKMNTEVPLNKVHELIESEDEEDCSNIIDLDDVDIADCEYHTEDQDISKSDGISNPETSTKKLSTSVDLEVKQTSDSEQLKTKKVLHESESDVSNVSKEKELSNLPVLKENIVERNVCDNSQDYALDLSSTSSQKDLESSNPDEHLPTVNSIESKITCKSSKDEKLTVVESSPMECDNIDELDGTLENDVDTTDQDKDKSLVKETVKKQDESSDKEDRKSDVCKSTNNMEIGDKEIEEACNVSISEEKKTCEKTDKDFSKDVKSSNVINPDKKMNSATDTESAEIMKNDQLNLDLNIKEKSFDNQSNQTQENVSRKMEQNETDQCQNYEKAKVTEKLEGGILSPINDVEGSASTVIDPDRNNKMENADIDSTQNKDSKTEEKSPVKNKEDNGDKKEIVQSDESKKIVLNSEKSSDSIMSLNHDNVSLNSDENITDLERYVDNEIIPSQPEDKISKVEKGNKQSEELCKLDKKNKETTLEQEEIEKIDSIKKSELLTNLLCKLKGDVQYTENEVSQNIASNISREFNISEHKNHKSEDDRSKLLKTILDRLNNEVQITENQVAQDIVSEILNENEVTFVPIPNEVEPMEVKECDESKTPLSQPDNPLEKNMSGSHSEIIAKEIIKTKSLDENEKQCETDNKNVKNQNQMQQENSKVLTRKSLDADVITLTVEKLKSSIQAMKVTKEQISKNSETTPSNTNTLVSSQINSESPNEDSFRDEATEQEKLNEIIEKPDEGKHSSQSPEEPDLNASNSKLNKDNQSEDLQVAEQEITSKVDLEQTECIKKSDEIKSEDLNKADDKSQQKDSQENIQKLNTEISSNKESPNQELSENTTKIKEECTKTENSNSSIHEDTVETKCSNVKNKNLDTFKEVGIYPDDRKFCEKMSLWQLVCDSLDEWTQLSESFKDTKTAKEKKLHKIIENDFLPEIPAIMADKVSMPIWLIIINKFYKIVAKQ